MGMPALPPDVLSGGHAAACRHRARNRGPSTAPDHAHRRFDVVDLPRLHSERGHLCSGLPAPLRPSKAGLIAHAKVMLTRIDSDGEVGVVLIGAGPRTVNAVASGIVPAGVDKNNLRLA